MSDVIENLKELKIKYKRELDDYIKNTYQEQNKFIRIKKRA